MLFATKKEEILNNYNLTDSIYRLNENLTQEQRKSLFKLEDSVGLFDFDRETIFHQTVLWTLDKIEKQKPDFLISVD